MALNFTQRSHFSKEFSGSCAGGGGEGREAGGGGGENVYAEILSVLPDDPFNMAVTTATFTAFSEWLEGLERDIVWDNLDSYFGSAVCLSTDPTAGSNGYEESEGGCAERFYPHDALFLAIGRLGLVDLLSVGRVCWALNIAVKGDPLLWRNIHVDKPLSERLNDDALLELTSRAQGGLLSLTIVDSLRVTDFGLTRVFQANPRLNKLSVPGCVRLSINGIMGNIRAHNGGGMGITHLRIKGIFGVTTTLYRELIFLLGVGAGPGRIPGAGGPRYYHRVRTECPADEESALDIEICSKCGDVKAVYDCPTVGCGAGDDPERPCRGCITCVARCVHCGRCIRDRFYEETFFLDMLCYDCRREDPSS